MPAELTLCFFFSFFLCFHFSSYLSFLFFFLVFYFVIPLKWLLLWFLPFFLFLFLPSFAHNKGPFLQLLLWLDFTVLALNHLCLIQVYLSTTTRSFVCHSPSPNKDDYFVCQSTVTPLPATVWVSSLSLSLMACTQWLQLSFTRLGGVSSQQNTSPKRALAGISKQVFPFPHHQTMPSYL